MQTDLTDTQFQRFSRLIYEECGINLHDGKKALLRARLAKRIRYGGFSSFKEYYEHVLDGEGAGEIVHLLDSISTNLTYFFREPQHFDFLGNTVVQEIQRERCRAGDRHLRIWSAGCSSGEEPYSLAITVLEALERPEKWKIEILATDLSTQMLAKAQHGVYPTERIKTIPPEIKRRYFQRGLNAWQGHVRVKPQVRSRITFSRLNLMEPFPFEESFDVIFCRNVMIYFDKPTQEGLVRRFYESLRLNGHLFVGHSESLTSIKHEFRYLMPSVYRK